MDHNEMVTYGRNGYLRQASTGSHNHQIHPHHSATRCFRVRPDIIDRLDDVSALQYHHEGPYDAACAERNHYNQSSPIHDCLHRHRPLDGVAFYPPGVTDPEGNTYHYPEGSNMNFMWDPGMKFTSADFANDPFYSEDRVGPLRRIGSLRKLQKALSTYKCLRKVAA
ncbi:hypothetical protein V8E54_007384 [Elaphomyces granulatus]